MSEKAKVIQIDGQLMVAVPQIVVDFLSLQDDTILEFEVGDALVTLWKSEEVE